VSLQQQDGGIAARRKWLTGQQLAAAAVGRAVRSPGWQRSRCGVGIEFGFIRRVDRRSERDGRSAALCC